MLSRIPIDHVAQGHEVRLEGRLVAGGRASADPRDSDRGNYTDNDDDDDKFNQAKRMYRERKSGVPSNARDGRRSFASLWRTTALLRMIASGVLSAAWGGPIGGLHAQKLGGVTLVSIHRTALGRRGSLGAARQGSPKQSVSRHGPWLLIAICGLALQKPALASYHFMQIEQVIGGVNGDPAAQAIQLRMRANGQHIVSNARLLAWDAAGENPVLLLDFSTDVSNGAVGTRVLAATAGFAAYSEPAAVPDFVLTAAIPSEYLAAGSLTFENDDGTVLAWRLSWGGIGYTGNTTGALTNDDDQEFGPPFVGPLSSGGLQALLFQGDAQANSASNAADYAETVGAAVFTNNAGQTFTIIPFGFPNDPDQDSENDNVGAATGPAPRVCGAGMLTLAPLLLLWLFFSIGNGRVGRSEAKL